MHSYSLYGMNENCCLGHFSNSYLVKELKIRHHKNFHVYTDSKQMICGLNKAVRHVLQNDFRPGGQRADTKPVWAQDTDHMKQPETAPKHTVQTTEVDPVTATEENCPGILPRLCQQ